MLGGIRQHPFGIGRDMIRYRRVVWLQTGVLGWYDHHGQFVNTDAIQGRTRRAGQQIAEGQLVQRHRHHRLVRASGMEGRDLAGDLLGAELKLRNQPIARHRHLVQGNLVKTRHVPARNILRRDALGGRQGGL